MKSYVSRFPVPSEWHGVAGSVMPVWYDVHRTCDATFLADEAAGDRRPRQVLGQRIQPDIDHAAVALTARALDVAGHMAVCDPFRRTARRVFACPSRL
jgi:hypothetical protein